MNRSSAGLSPLRSTMFDSTTVLIVSLFFDLPTIGILIQLSLVQDLLVW